MSMSDPIADMLTRIRNANTAKHDTVDVPNSKIKMAIANILLDEGYISKIDLVDNGSFKDIRITLKYGADRNDRILTGLQRISKPGMRVYASKDNVPKVLDWELQSFPPTRALLPTRRQESCRLAARFLHSSGNFHIF